MNSNEVDSAAFVSATFLATTIPEITSEPFNITETPPRTRDENLAKLEILVLFCMFLVTVVGNFIVIAGIYFRLQKMSRMYYFILHLSFADLITAFFNVGTQFVMELTWPEFRGGDWLCKTVKYLQILGPYSSSYVLVMTALDRYQAICYPMSNCNWTARQSKVMLGVAWGIAHLFSTPQLFIFSLKEVASGSYDCWATFPDWGAKAYVTWYSCSFFIAPLLILVFAYTCICRAIWQNANMKNMAYKIEASGRGRSGTSIPKDEPDLESTATCCNNSHSPPPNFSPQNERTTTTEETHFIAYPSTLSFTDPGEFPPNQTNRIGNGNTRHGLIRHDSPDLESGPSSSSSPSGTFSPIAVKNKKNSGHNHHHPSLTSQLRTRIIYTWSKIRLAKKDKDGEFETGEQGNSAEDNNSKENGGSGGGLGGGSKQALIPLRLIKLNNSASPYRTTVQIVTRASVNPNFTTSLAHPRAHSVKGISRAKIKTVKLTITVILCYIMCSSPFIAAQLWSTYDPHAQESPFYTGTVFTILTLLASLNSCVNPYIFLFFNPNLLQDFIRGCRGNHFRIRRQFSGTSPMTGRTSAGGTQRTN